jgi:hypothetical protein
VSDLVRFTETMRGSLSPRTDVRHEDAACADASGEAIVVLTVVTPDVDAMVADPNHRNRAWGVVLLPALHPLPLSVEYGHFDLFVDAAPGVLHMRYALGLRAEDGQLYHLRGIKEALRRRWWPTFLTDTTTLFTDVFRGEGPEGVPVLRGVLRMGPVGVTMQGLSFRGGLFAIARFMRFYVGALVRTYLRGRRAPLRPTWDGVGG